MDKKARFNRRNGDNDIKLEIWKCERNTRYACMINAQVNNVSIAQETKASISLYPYILIY